jgi:ATP-dependent helicase/nuclease subunit A
MATAVNRRHVKRDQTPFTSEQHRAIFEREVPVALSAGAGCGKTFVLTERYLSHLEPDDNGKPCCELSDLVAITFTERAAREMRDRIRAKCLERLRNAPTEHGDYWLDLLRSLDSARVSTIHSFCATLLRSHAVEAQLDPRFAVLEAAQAETLLAELIDDVLREKLAARCEAVMDLVVVFGLPRLKNAIADLVHGARGHDFRRWLERTPEELVAAWSAFHRANVLPALLSQLAASPPAKTLLKIFREHTLDDDYWRERRRKLVALVPKLAESKQVAADLDEIHEFARLQGIKNAAWPSDEVKESFKNAAEALRERIRKLKARIDFDSQSALSSAQLGLTMLKQVDEVDRAYDAAKAELAVLDFDDLLLRARQLLTDPKHRDLRERIASNTRLLVDECQDTDPVQVELIKALCGDDDRSDKLFFVGDHKQSIYRFRGADPRVFKRLQTETPAAGRLPLSCNFRSQPPILHFVNALFCDALGDDFQSLVPHRAQSYDGPAIEFMWCTADGSNDTQDPNRSDSDDDSDETPDPEPANAAALRRREADWIARRICQLLANEKSGERPTLLIHEKSSPQPRPIKPGDIAILFRSLSEVSYYEEALRSYRIDYYLVGGHAFYAQQEIYDVLNLLRSLAYPADEVSLAGVLRSPFFSLADETLFWLTEQGHGLWAGLRAASLPAAIDEQQRQRVMFAARVLTDLRARKDRMPIAALIGDALHRTGYDAALLAEFLGERKLANLRKLIAQARAFDNAGVLRLSDFIVQLSQFVVRQPREPLAATHPEATDVVRLMTIHQSKGLEFPIVFVPDIGRRSNDHQNDAAYDGELGPLVRLPEDHEHSGAMNGHRMHAITSAAEDHDEAIRLLYVATTRAADFLVLSSGVKDIEKAGGVWMQLLAERFDLSTGRLVATLPHDYPQPRVAVVTEPPAVSAHRGIANPRLDLEKSLSEIEAAAAELSCSQALPGPHTGREALPRATEEQGQDPSFADPVPIDASARRRFSVSRLHGYLEDHEPTGTSGDSSEPREPRAVYATASPQMRDAIALGTLVHAALASLDLGQPPRDLKTHIAIHADKLRLGDSELRREATQLLERFIGSPRAAGMRHGTQTLREVEFLLAWPPPLASAGERSKTANTSAGRYLQGYLDCLYQDSAGRWRIVDYKTNQVSPDTLAELVATNEMQMLAYGLAAEQALGEPPAELVLHFLRTGDEHKFAWDDKVRARAIRLVDQAINAMCGNTPAPKRQLALNLET